MFSTALITGVAGNLHCARDVQSLAIAVTNFKLFTISNRIIQSGRITTYGVFGAIDATIGYILPLSEFSNFIAVQPHIAAHSRYPRCA